MFNKPTDTLTLANGVKIPCLGYGTWQTPAGGVACEGVKTALKCGYRHIDTANAYGNEEDVGKGIKESGVPREEIFLTTKHWITDGRKSTRRHGAASRKCTRTARSAPSACRTTCLNS